MEKKTVEPMDEALKTHVETCVSKQMSDNDRDNLNVSGFDLSLLIPLLIPILTEMLSGCFSKASESDVAEVLAHGRRDARVRQACYVAIGKSTDNKLRRRTQLAMALGLADACETATPEQRIQFVTGVVQSVDWSMS